MIYYLVKYKYPKEDIKINLWSKKPTGGINWPVIITVHMIFLPKDINREFTEERLKAYLNRK